MYTSYLFLYGVVIEGAGERYRGREREIEGEGVCIYVSYIYPRYCL